MGAKVAKQATEASLKQCTLWKTDRSPCCRAVMMALDALNLSVNEVDLNMDGGEHRTPEILMMNARHTLPILKDRELILSDSHAICTYLVTRYCDNGSLLPQDAGGRSVVEQQLHYNSGILHPVYRSAANPILFEGCHHIMPQNVSAIEHAYTELEDMLSTRPWFASANQPMLSDICICATISTLNLMVPIDNFRYPKLSSWLQRMSEEMFYLTANTKGLSEFSRRIDASEIVTQQEFKCPRTSEKRRSITQLNIP